MEVLARVLYEYALMYWDAVIQNYVWYFGSFDSQPAGAEGFPRTLKCPEDSEL